MKTKSIARFLSLAVASGLLMTMLVGCLDDDSRTKQDVSSTVSETAADTGRKDGERFEDVIILEGEEETVRYEHVRNEKIGFELDYEYESLNRMTGENYEKYVSIYDDAKKPDNYLEVTYSSEKADSTVKTVKTDLSKKYETVKEETWELDGAGQCQRINATGGKGKTARDSLQTVTIIPAGDGCIVAAAHYTIESAEGFGARFSKIVNTLSVINR